MKKFKNNIEQRLTGRHKKSFKFVRSVKGKIVLDIGCSYGWFEKWAVENGCQKVIGIEPHTKDLVNAKREVKKGIFKIGSATKIPLRKGSVDIVTAFDVIEHIPKKTEELMFKEVVRVLRPGGIFYLSTPNKNLLSCALDPAWWLTGHRHYSLNYFKIMVKHHPLIIEKTEYGGGIWEMISMINLYLCKWLIKREMIFKDTFEAKRSEEYSKPHGWATLFIKLRKRK